MNPELPALIVAGESDHVEFKRGIAGVYQAVAALLNTSGGVVLVGVDDDGTVIGVEEPSSLAASLERELRHHISPPAAVSTAVQSHKGLEVIVIDVPKGHDGPYVVDGAIYVRRGTSTLPATRGEIDSLLGPAAATRWERRPCLGATLDNLDDERIRTVAQKARDRLGLRDDETGSPMDVLQALHLARGETIFNGAVVLFGRHPSSFFPQVRVRAASFLADRKMADNRVFDGNLFDLLDQSMEFLHRALPVRSELPTDQLERKDMLAIPTHVLREALLNALVHRDYDSYTGGISLIIRDDALEVWNSGQLPEGITLDSLRTGRASRPGNPDIAHVVFLRGYIERLGLGTQLILDAYRDQPAQPEWRLDSGGVLLVLPMRQAAGPLFRPNARQVALLENTPPGGVLTASDYVDGFASSVTPRQARADLSELVEHGFLNRRGAGRSTNYVRTKEGLPQNDIDGT